MSSATCDKASKLQPIVECNDPEIKPIRPGDRDTPARTPVNEVELSRHGTSHVIKPDASTIPPTNQEAENFCAARFANKKELALWFPRILADKPNNWQIWSSRSGRTISLQITIIAVILISNLASTIFAISRYGSENGVGLLYEGDCNVVKSLDQWIHLLINVLSTGLLSASNYCMQRLMAPTRENTDKAHQQNNWLDIGVPSFRNFRFVGGWRRAAWLLLGLSSLPIHLMYNSAVFRSLSSNNYTIAVVKDSFVHGSSWSLGAAEERRATSPGWHMADERVNPYLWNHSDIISGIQRDVVEGLYTRINTSACFDLYDDYWQPQGNAVILVRNETVQHPSNHDSLLMYVSIIPRSDNWPKNMWALEAEPGTFVARSQIPKPVRDWYLGPHRYEVASCFVQSTEQLQTRCRFEYSPYILLVICLMNVVRIAIMISMWIFQGNRSDSQEQQTAILCTLGDAIASFMRNPDSTTVDMGLATKEDFLPKRTWYGKVIRPPSPPHSPRPFKSQPKQWRSALSLGRWIVGGLSLLPLLVGGMIAYSQNLASFRHRKLSTSILSFWQLGFGTLTPQTLVVTYLPTQDPAGLFSNVLLANTPHLAWSIAVMIFNASLTTFLVQHEFSRMHGARKTLRVSEPTGIQRSTYFISLPLRYGIPFYAVSAGFHWLLSQTLFLARVAAITPEGEVDRKHSYSVCGCSPVALFTTILTGSAFVAGFVCLSITRRYDGVMRMVSTNSRAISAACHVLLEDREDGYLLPVQWGVVAMSGGVGKCAFTTAPEEDIKMPEEGRLYK
ncbi:hypothetical protein QBC41DRAFT_273392 [Cercophora samala]|uniref:DUF6536 domain-containing protein n=1 Tax=Cercophora samala TaxID=330535 RepID=A0AA39ZFP1_9PEZI|nr:hypothetical protein QBC41DRAFT_273392 [Cercophora samala]